MGCVVMDRVMQYTIMLVRSRSSEGIMVSNMLKCYDKKEVRIENKYKKPKYEVGNG